MDDLVGKVAEPTHLTEISVAELASSVFSPGNIFWVRQNGSRVKVVGCGEVLDHDYLTKFEHKGLGLQAERIADVNIVSHAKTLFFSLSQAKTENERITQRLHLLSWFKNIYWDGTHRGSLLDLVKIGTEVFYDFDDDLTQRLTNASNFLYKRSALVAPMAVFVCLAIGYLDIKFLRDIYHLCYLFDFALNQDNISYNLMKATELERRRSGDGISCLFMGDNPGPELEAFQFHPRKSMLEAKEFCAKYFTDSNLVHLILKHHERVNGKGFPFGINEDEMSDLDTIIIFLNHLLPFDELVYQRNDGKGFLKRAIGRESTEESSEIFGERLKEMIAGVFDNLVIEPEEFDDDEGDVA